MEDDHSGTSSVREKDHIIASEHSNTLRRNSCEESAIKNTSDLGSVSGSDVSSDNEDAKSPLNRSKKRLQRFTDSEDESEVSFAQNNENNLEGNEPSLPMLDSDGSSNKSIFKSAPQKSRIRKVSTSGSDTDSDKGGVVKNEEQQSRMKNKNDKLKQKFKGLMKSRKEESESQETEERNREMSSPDTSDDEVSSIEKIRQVCMLVPKLSPV